MLTIRKVNIDECDALLAFSKSTFYEFFAHLNTPENMEAYSSAAFNYDNMLAQLSNPDSLFYFAEIDGKVAGYLKLNFNDAQTEYKDKNALEIERIYVSGKFHGQRVGKQLINFAIALAQQKQFEYVWLGVWEHNDNALGFYRHHGFEQIGTHEFLLGDDRQMDLLMKKFV